MRIIFVRHGHPDYAADSLTETGRAQAAAAAVRLGDEGIEAIYASPMGRAKETAAHTAESLGLPVTVLPFMRELSWGNPVFNPWHRAREMAQDGVDLLRDDFTAAPDFPGRAVLDQAAAAARGFDGWLAELGYRREGNGYRCTAPAPGTIAVFSHGGSGSAVIAHLLGMPFLAFCHRVPQNFTAVTTITLKGEVGERILPRVEVMNDFRHIRGIG